MRVYRSTPLMLINQHLNWYGSHDDMHISMGPVSDYWHVSMAPGSSISLIASNLPDAFSYPMISIHSAHYGKIVTLALTAAQCYGSLYVLGDLGVWIEDAYEDQLTHLSLEEEE